MLTPTGPLILTRRLAGVDPLGVITASFAVAALLLAPFAADHLPRTAPTSGVIASVAGLATACTALAFVAFFALIAEVGPARASIITNVLPLVAMTLGVAELGEPLRVAMVPGLAGILAGSWLATGGRLRLPAALRPATPEECIEPQSRA